VVAGSVSVVPAAIEIHGLQVVRAGTTPAAVGPCPTALRRPEV
jgi:hypothetical protein